MCYHHLSVESDDKRKSQFNSRSRRPSARARSAESSLICLKEDGSAEPKGYEAERAVVITGICGRMGQLLARQLHRRGPVIGIDRRPFRECPEDIAHYQFDLRSKKTQDLFRTNPIRAVVHLGTMHNLRRSDKEHYSWNLVGFRKLLEYLEKYNVPKLVLLSSANIYGPRPENAQFLSEEAPLLGAQDFSRIRDIVEVDMLAQSFFWKWQETETVILRPCHILGKVRNAPSNYLRLSRLVTVMGYDPMIQIIHERDVVDAIILALEPGKRGVFNLSGSGQLPLSRIIRLLNKDSIALPSPLVKGFLAGLWPYRAASYPAPEIDHLRYMCMVDGKRAEEYLGFKPIRSIEETLQAVYSDV